MIIKPLPLLLKRIPTKYGFHILLIKPYKLMIDFKLETQQSFTNPSLHPSFIASFLLPGN